MERYPAGARQRDAGRRRDPHRRRRSSCASTRRAPRRRLPQRRAPASPCRAVGIRTMLSVPLLVRGRTLGALTFGWQTRAACPTRTRRSSRRRSRAAWRSRSTTARSTRRRTASASGSRRSMRQLPLGVIIAETASRKLLFTNQRAQELLGPGASEHSIAGPARRAHPPRARGRVDVGHRDRRDPRRRHARHRLAERRAGARCARRDRRRRGDALRPHRAPQARGGAERSSPKRASRSPRRSTCSTRSRELVELAVPRLADWCTIDMLDHGEIRNVGVAHADPETARLARRVHERRPGARAGLERRLRPRSPRAARS